MDDRAFMASAISLAIENVRSGRGGPFAALIARGSELIATGTNLVTATRDPTAHAEVVAIREACHALGAIQLTGCTIYVTCEPCPMCLGAIYWARLARICFAATRADAAAAGFIDADVYDQLRLPRGQRSIPAHQVMHQDSLAVFAEWMRKADRQGY